MASVGIGRGRAWGRGRPCVEQRALGEPLRQPGQITRGPSTESKIGVARLSQQLHSLSVSNDGYPTGLAEIRNILQNASLNEEDFERSVKAIHIYGCENKKHAEIASVLCKEFADIECNGKKFKLLLLDLLNQDYEGREIISADTEKFVNCVTFLCEVFHNVRLKNNAMINFLPQPIYDYLEMLLDGGADIEIEAFAQLMKKNGRELEEWNSEKMYELLIKVRKKIIGSSSTVKSRSLLLSTLEMALNSWRPVRSGVNSMYENFSKSVFTLENDA